MAQSRTRRFVKTLTAISRRFTGGLPTRDLPICDGPRPGLDIPAKRDDTDPRHSLALFEGSDRDRAREEALKIPALFRCVSMLSGMIAQLFTENISIQKSGTKENADDLHRELIDGFRHSLDGGLTSSHSLMEACSVDYFTDGNTLIWAKFDPDGTPDFERLEPQEASYDETTGIYNAVRGGSPNKESVEVHESEVIHISWGLTTLDEEDERGPKFAVPPIKALAPALAAARAAGLNVLRKLLSSRQHLLHFIPEEDQEQDRITEIANTMDAQARGTKGGLAIAESGTLGVVKDPYQSPEMLALRQWIVREIARAYGVQAVHLQEEGPNWGRSMEESQKIFFQTGLRRHVNAFIAEMSLRLLEKGYRFKVNYFDIIKGNVTDVARIAEILRGDGQRRPLGTDEEIRDLFGLDALTEEQRRELNQRWEENLEAQRDQPNRSEKEGTNPLFSNTPGEQPGMVN